MIENYMVVKEIGRGSYGVVWEATHLKSKERVAIKAVSIGKDPLKSKRLLREIRVLRSLSENSNVVKLLNVLVSDDTTRVYLVFEYAMTDLYQLQCSKVYFTEDDVKRALFQILLGVAASHRSGVVFFLCLAHS